MHSKGKKTRFLTLLFVSLGVMESDALLAQVTRGPYLQTGTPTSVIVRWRTGGANEGVVRYGSDPLNLTLSRFESAVRTEHAVPLTGLSPETKYYYTIGTPTATLAGDGSYFFVTSPVPAAPKPIRIWVLGDSGTKNANAAAVRDAYLQLPNAPRTDLWLMLGDNAYSDGTDLEYQAAVFDMYPTLLRQSVLWPTLGNHDGHTADSASQSGPYYDIFTLPKNGEAGGVPSGTEAYYSFDYGNIHFICLESYETDRSPSGAMMQWLEADLQLNDKPWIIAFWHHPPYTKGTHDSDTESRHIDMRQYALPILEQYGVDLVLGGHSHNYERSYLIDGHYGHSSTFTPAMMLDSGDGREAGDGAYLKSPSIGAPREGAVYVVAGSSGATYPASLDHPVMFMSLQSLGSMVIDVSGNRLDATFLRENGSTPDYFTLVKGADSSPPTVVSVEAQGDPNLVRVQYSKSMDVVTATTLSNYSIDRSVTLQGAVLETGDRTVTLAVSTLTRGVQYTLTVSNVTDVQGNPIAPVSTAVFEYFDIVSASFQDGVAPDPGYGGTRDTYIAEASPSSNFGSDILLPLDGDDSGVGDDVVVLLKWDISKIPPGAQVQSVELTINVSNTSPGPYEIYGLTRDWLEDEATWIESSSGTSWGAAGAQGSSDRDPLSAGTVSGNSTGPQAFSLNAKGVALVQSWVDDPATNFGFVIGNTSTTNGLDFHSREAAIATNRPRLSVVYNAGGASNNAPVAVDDGYSVANGGSLTVPAAGVLANDTDPDGDNLTAVLVSGPAKASAFNLNADGSFSYQHDGLGATSDSFTYKANDGALVSNTVTVTISVTAASAGPDELVVDFGSMGFWHRDRSVWSLASSWNAVAAVRWQDRVAVAFGSGRGIYVYDGNGWQHLTDWDPVQMVAWGDSLAVDFGPGRGLWAYKASGWVELTPLDPERIEAWGDKLAIALGVGRGLWIYDGSNWTNLTSWDPYDIEVWGNRLVAAFDAGRGLWAHDMTGWAQLTIWEPIQMVAGQEKLTVAFGAGRGLWNYSGVNWEILSSWDPYDIVPWGDNLAVAFDAGRGLWLREGSAWRQMTHREPAHIEAVANELIVGFGPGLGLHAHDGASWSSIASLDAEGLEAVQLKP